MHYWNWSGVVVFTLALGACSNAAVGADGEESQTAGVSETMTNPTQPTTGESQGTGTAEGTGHVSGDSEGPGGTTIELSLTDVSGTTADTMMTASPQETETETRGTSGPDGTSGTDSTDGTTAEGSTSTTLDPSGSTGMNETGMSETGESTGAPCIPTEEVCNDLDDDCDNIVDDVDVGMDGICDCLSIALVGNQGANPSSEFQTWLQDQGTTVVRINSNVMNDIDVPLTPAVLANYDILILDWLQRSYTVQESGDVRAWIEAGGGLMTMTGHVNNQVTIDRCNSFITPMGLTYNGSKGFFSGPVTQFNPHPITMGLTSITFLGGLYVDIVDDGIGVNQVIMTLPPGPVGVVQDRLEGRVFVFGDEWVEFDSEWQNMPEIQQFWVQTLAWLGPKDSCIVPQ